MTAARRVVATTMVDDLAGAAGLMVERGLALWIEAGPTVSFTVGRFRQNIGVLNRWHEHDLDQTQHPSAMRLVLGDEGLVVRGLAAKWL